MGVTLSSTEGYKKPNIYTRKGINLIDIKYSDVKIIVLFFWLKLVSK
jgi:hypothetical protein